MKRNTFKTARLLTLSLVLMVSLVACGVTRIAEASNPSSIIVGAIYPLSGSQASTGMEIRNGIELAIDIVNNNWPSINLPLAEGEGIPSLGGAKMSIVWGDSQGNPERGMATAEQILNQDNAVAIIGCFNSSVSATVATVTERHEKVFLNPDSTNPGLTKNGWEWFFRLTPDDYMFTRNLIDFIIDMNEQKGAGIKTAALVYDNSLTGQDIGELFNTMSREAGLEVVLDLVFAPNSPELNSEVMRISRANADVVMHFAFVSDAILLMRTYKDQGYMPKMFIANGGGFTDSSFVATLGADADYICNRSVYSLDIGEQRPIVTQINDIYRERYGFNMNEYSSRGFMGVIVLADAINRAGSTDSEAIRKALFETNIPEDQIILAWTGVQFDSYGQNILGRAMVGQNVNGEFPTVWPFDLAQAEPVYPAFGWSNR